MWLRVDRSAVSPRSPAASACTCATSAATGTQSKCELRSDANQRQDDYGKNGPTHSLISPQVRTLDARKAVLGSMTGCTNPEEQDVSGRASRI